MDDLPDATSPTDLTWADMLNKRRTTAIDLALTHANSSGGTFPDLDELLTRARKIDLFLATGLIEGANPHDTDIVPVPAPAD